MARKVTLQTIAEHLGISRTTVSNAYNRPDQLAPELRERVLATAAELGYRGPDAAARRLRSGGPEAIGLLFGETLTYTFSDPGAVLFLQGFACATEEAGLPVLVLPGTSAEGGFEAAVRGAVVGGFCVYSLPVDNPGFAAAAARRLPLIVVDEPRTPEHAFIGIDDRRGARLAAGHLAELGHRRVGVACFRTADDGYEGPLTPDREAAATYPVTSSRLAGWREGLEPAGIAWHDVVKEERVRNTRESGAAALRRLLARDPAITAVLCATDQMALGVLAAAAEAGRADLSVVGFDDVPAAAARELTTVRQPLFEKGLTAGRLLVEPPEVPAPQQIMLPVELVARASTRPV